MIDTCSCIHCAITLLLLLLQGKYSFWFTDYTLGYLFKSDYYAKTVVSKKLLGQPRAVVIDFGLAAPDTATWTDCSGHGVCMHACRHTALLLQNTVLRNA
jgi:hypothetical protein